MAYQNATHRWLGGTKLSGHVGLDSVLLDRVSRACDRMPVCDAHRVGKNRLMSVGCQVLSRQDPASLSTNDASLETRLAREMQDHLVNSAGSRPCQSGCGRPTESCGFCGQLHRAFALASVAMAANPEGRQRLSRCVSALPPKVRQVMTLYHRDKFTYQEIARTMNVSPRVVCSLHREGMFLLIPQLRPLTPAPRCPQDAPKPRRAKRERMSSADAVSMAGLTAAAVSLTLAVINMLV